MPSNGPEWIEVPAGRFHVIRIDMNLEIGEKKVRDTSWWAPNMGKVKQDRDGAIEVMKSFKLGDGRKRKADSPAGVGR